MSAKILSESAFSIINQYKNFTTGIAVCTIPYYNNRRQKARARLRAQIGKGSPREIRDEAETTALQEKINLKALDSISLKKFLVDKNIGIDCSGLTYHILTAEHGSLKLSFPFQKGVLGTLRAKFRPLENADVATFAHNDNTRIIETKDIVPGDIITMVGGAEGKERDHVIVVHETDYKDNVLVSVSYTHSIAWPTDGEYGHGVRQGVIRITDPGKLISEQEWVEADRTDGDNYTHMRAQKSKTEIRRLNWL